MIRAERQSNEAVNTHDFGLPGFAAGTDVLESLFAGDPVGSEMVFHDTTFARPKVVGRDHEVN